MHIIKKITIWDINSFRNGARTGFVIITLIRLTALKIKIEKL